MGQYLIKACQGMVKALGLMQRKSAVEMRSR
jgi:hypothetical protein